MGNVLSRTVAVLGLGVLGLLAGCGSSLTAGGATDTAGTSQGTTTDTATSPEGTATEPVAGPPGLTDRGGVLFGQPTAPVTVTVMSDFRCPACLTFHEANSAQLAELAAAGTVQVEHIPVSILDRFSEGTRFSTRAAGAAFCVAETDRDSYLEFEDVMYANQPTEGTPGPGSEEIAALAAGVGVSEAGQDCIRQDRYADYATQVTEDASTAGMRGTPTVYLNDEEIGDWTPQNLRTQIETMANR